MTSPEQFHQVLREEAQIKRFFERWTADPRFRDALRERPQEALAEVEDAVAPADLAHILSNGDDPFVFATWPPMRRMWRISEAKAEWVRSFYLETAVPARADVRVWRERQIRRQVHDLGPFHAASNIHSSLCVELTSGCSVGCWFCALSPDSLDGAFEWNEGNAAAFRRMLDGLAERLGPALGSGFLYWATDPLDNPDYERFCLAFREATGVFPPTTTARHLVDVERTRRLLALAEEHGCWLNRFSVLSRTQMARTHREFSARELAMVECLPLNKEASFAYGNAGRFRERALEQPELLDTQREKLADAPWHAADPRYAEAEDYANGSIGCVTGLLVNLVRREVRLISPCTADDRWPLGYIVFGEARYDDAEGFLEAVDGLYGTLRTEVREADRLRFAEPLAFEPADNGFRLRGRFGTAEEVTVETADGSGAVTDPAAVRALGVEIARGDRTAGELATGGPLPEAGARALLADLFHRGVLAEEAFDG